MSTLRVDSIRGQTAGTDRYVIQVKQAVEKIANFNTSSTSFVASGLDIDFTPTLSTSKVLIQALTTMDTRASGRQIFATLYRDSTRLDTTLIASDSDGLGSFYNGSDRDILGSSF